MYFIWDLPVVVVVIVLIIAFFQWQQKRWNRQEQDKALKAFNLYLQLSKRPLEEQALFLNHSKPFYLRGRVKRLYYFACRRWDESGNLYDDVEEIIRSSRKSRKLRKKVKLRTLWRKVFRFPA